MISTVPFRCPVCAARLPDSTGPIGCSQCGAVYTLDRGVRCLLTDERRVALGVGAQASGPDSVVLSEADVLRANVAYHAAHADRYEQDPSTAQVFSMAAEARIREVAEMALSQTDGQAWLDVGCGTGHVLAIAASLFPATLGLDLSTDMLVKAAGRGLNVARAEADCLPIPDQSVDVVSAFALLHHLFDPQKFYREAYRVLRPGGILYTDADPNVRQRGQSAAYRGARRLYYAMKRRLAGPSIDTDPDSRRTAHVADYQMFNSADFNGDTQVVALRSVGFRPAHAIYHFDASSLYLPSEAPVATHLRGLVRTPPKNWFDMRIAGDHFILLAHRPRLSQAR